MNSMPTFSAESVIMKQIHARIIRNALMESAPVEIIILGSFVRKRMIVARMIMTRIVNSVYTVAHVIPIMNATVLLMFAIEVTSAMFIMRNGVKYLQNLEYFASK